MNLYHLRYFVTLAKLEHYTKAAEELCITQPSLSHAISLLEKELGVTLFQKEGRNIVLTKCGKIFLEKVKESLKILDNSILELKSISNGEGYIDLGFLRTLGTNFVPRLAKSYIENNKDKKINFNSYSNQTVVLRLNTAVNLTDYKYLKFTIASAFTTSAGSSAKAKIGVATNSNGTGITYSNEVEVAPSSKDVVVLDVTGLSGMYFVYISSYTTKPDYSQGGRNCVFALSNS